MKRGLIFFVSAIAMIFMSCGERKQVKLVAHAFLQEYYEKKDFKAAQSYCTEITKEHIEQRAIMYTLNPYAEEESLENLKVEVEQLELQKTKAICHYSVGGEERKLNLSKTDDSWQIDMPESVTMVDGKYSLLFPMKKESGGFASASSESVKLSDIPEE